MESILQEREDVRCTFNTVNPTMPTNRVTQEIHVMHDFQTDFYGHDMKVMVLGYIRPELDYVSRGLFCN